MDRYVVVADEQMISNFLKDIGYEQMHPVAESFLVQTCFRSKKLTAEEKAKLGNRHKDSYMTKTLKCGMKSGDVDPYESSMRKLYELEVPVRACTYNIGTENEIAFPQHAFVTYILPNTSNEVEVATQHAKSTFDQLCLNTSGNVDMIGLAKKNTDYRSERSTCVTSRFVNFDIDVENCTGWDLWKEKSEIISNIIRDTFQTNEQLLVVICSGGFHVLVPKEVIKSDPYRLDVSLQTQLEKITGARIKEVEFKGAKSFTPLPGTYQYGDDEQHVVKYVKI